MLSSRIRVCVKDKQSWAKIQRQDKIAQAIESPTRRRALVVFNRGPQQQQSDAPQSSVIMHRHLEMQQAQHHYLVHIATSRQLIETFSMIINVCLERFAMRESSQIHAKTRGSMA